MNKKIFDISLTLSSETAVYPGDPKVQIKETGLISEGNVCNISQIIMGNHNGTHMDAPKHFIDEGETIDHTNFDCFIGKCKVIELDDSINSIKVADIAKYDIKPQDRIIFKTRNSKFVEEQQFHFDFVYLEGETAQYLASKNILTVGIDYFSVEGMKDTAHVVHKSLLSKNILIIEGLCLKNVPAGEYELMALPLKLKNGNGAPARVILREL